MDLSGQPADYRSIHAVVCKHVLTVVDDAAQCFGATYENRRVGTLAPMHPYLDEAKQDRVIEAALAAQR